MNIIIEDLKKSTCSKGKYVATFATRQLGQFSFSNYPVQINSADAEKMLQVLMTMYNNPEVQAYFKEHIPSPFFLENVIREHNCPLNPLLNYLAGPSKINFLDWQEDSVEYSKSTSGVAVHQYFKGYIFPYDHNFSHIFLHYFGRGSWNNIDYKKALTGWDFCNADKDLSLCLSKFTTWFVSAERYDQLCIDLKDICLTLESMLDQTFFTWNDKLQRETNLLHIMKQASEFRN